MDHVVDGRLDGPAGYDLRLIDKREIELVVADRLRQAGKDDHVLIERGGIARDLAVEKRRADLVVGPAFEQAGVGNAAVEIKFQLVAVGRADARAAEHREAAILVAARRTIELVIDDAVES